MSLTISCTWEEARRLSSFLQEQEQARQRITDLEHQARKLTEAGKVVPATAIMKRAGVLRAMWSIEEK